MSVKCVCPECKMKFSAPAGAASVTCPICDTSVAVAGAVKAVPPVRPVAAVRLVSPPARRVAAASGRRRLVLALGGGMVLLWLGGGIAALLYFLNEDHSSPPPEAHVQATSPEPVVVVVETQPVVPPSPPENAEQKKINAAIDRGVVYLKGQLKTPLAWPPNAPGGFGSRDMEAYPIGVTGLIGLALLECDVPRDDPAVKQCAQKIRMVGPQLDYTYALATAVLFLDRLGDKQDRELIRALALRLVAGQVGIGGWNYTCPRLNADEEKQLLNFLTSRGDGTGGPINVADFPANLQNCSALRAADPNLGAVGVGGDNSNTQFALLALWVARRHDLPVQPALVQGDRQFRGQQRADGSWDYQLNTFQSSMTCAGLLALAVGRSVAPKATDGKEPDKDPAIERGFRYLAARIGPDSPKYPGIAPDQVGTIIQSDSWGDLYYLWSLERVALVYDLKTIGGKDWYAWAAPRIVKAQKDDGSWKEFFSAPVDTCFALLVLKRSNVVPDLTSEVKKTINLKDISGPTAK